MAWGELGMPWHQYWREDRALDSLVVVRVDANFFLLGAEGVLAQLEGFELVVALEVGPAPHATVYDVGEAFTVRDLQPPI